MRNYELSILPRYIAEVHSLMDGRMVCDTFEVEGATSPASAISIAEELRDLSFPDAVIARVYLRDNE